MKFSVVALCLVASSSGFAPSLVGRNRDVGVTRRFAIQQEEDTKTNESVVINGDNKKSVSIDPDAEGLPWWWELVWQLDIMKLGTPGDAVTFGDSANVLRTNIEQIYGGFPSLDGCPLAEGALTDIADGTMFIGLQRYQNNYGSPYKLCFGPKSFLVISDPVQAKHILRDANTNYDKVGMMIELYNYFVLTLILTNKQLITMTTGHLGRNSRTDYGQGPHSCRSRNVGRPTPPNCSCLSQGMVGPHGWPLWSLQRTPHCVFE